MPSLSVLPSTAPFAAGEIAALNSVIAASSAEQRAWLSGFLAGYQVANAPAAAPAAPPGRRVPLTILFATDPGNAEALAMQTRKAAARLGFAPELRDMADTTPAQLAGLRNLLVIASTWGEGDPPQRAADFYAALFAADAPRLPELRYSVLALGDRASARFCETGRRIDAQLAELGATQVAERAECDLDYAAPAAAWTEAALATLAARAAEEAAPAVHLAFAQPDPAADAPAAWSREQPFAAAIATRQRLSGSRSTADTWHLELDLEGAAIAYEPGDALSVLPENDPALADAVLAAAGLSGDAALREALIGRYDITTLTPPQAARHAALLGRDAPVLEAAPGRHLLDLLEAAPARLDAGQLTALLRPLPPRSYSIASSRKAVGEAAHLLVAALRYTAHGRDRQGVASVDLTQRRRAGGRVGVFLKPNPHFRLPADPDRPVVMIGPGTGVAPFRAFMQEREATGARGRSWLVFGHRAYTHDFLYQLEWQDLLRAGTLSRLDVAFSRDQPDRRYVQHSLWDARRDLYAWLQDGAALYVCGDATAMARDVHATLLRILADQGGLDEAAAAAALAGLRRDGRYKRDVY